MSTIESYFEPLIGLNDDGLINIETAIWLAEKIKNDAIIDTCNEIDKCATNMDSIIINEIKNKLLII